MFGHKMSAASGGHILLCSREGGEMPGDLEWALLAFI